MIRGFSLGLFFKSLGRLFTDGQFRYQCEQWLSGNTSVTSSPPPAPAVVPTSAPAASPPNESVRLLSLLQREGRLVDFLMEEIQGIPDAQVGAAVKEIHGKCQKTLKEHVEIQPVSSQEEEAKLTVTAGFDPSELRLVGNLVGSPPYQGTVRHRGWKVVKLNLPPIPSGQNPMVLAPAEIEVV